MLRGRGRRMGEHGEQTAGGEYGDPAYPAARHYPRWRLTRRRGVFPAANATRRDRRRPPERARG